jgi:division protein CdvB (Snf7/Vps24/ESCRT-III family)
MKTTLEKVFETLNKVELKSERIELSVMDEIEDALSRGFSLEEFVEEALDKATTEFIKAKDIIRFDMSEAYSDAEYNINEAEKILKELGADSAKLDQFKKQLQDLDSLINDQKRKLDSF